MKRRTAAAIAAAVLALTVAVAAVAAPSSHEAGAPYAYAAEQDTNLISRAADGGVPNGPSINGVISGDRRWARLIAYQSEASDIVAGDTNGVSDVFSVSRTGHFTNTGRGAGQPWRAGRTRLLSRGLRGAAANGPSYNPSVDGAFRARPKCVAFLSDASNLVRNDTNGQTDAFLSKRGRAPRRVSLPRNRQSAADTTHAAVSPDCRKVAFVTGGKMYIRKGRRTMRVRHRGTAADPSWSQGLRYGLVFSTERGVFLSKRGNRKRRLVARGGRNPGYNDIKRQVVTYEKTINGTTQIVARDLGRRERVVSRRGGARGNGDSRDPVIGNSGYYVTFESDASNLGLNATGQTGDRNGVTDVYLYTDVRDITLVQSVEEKAVPVPGGGENPSMSFYANYIVFDSPAPLGTRGDGPRQVFMRYLGGL